MKKHHDLVNEVYNNCIYIQALQRQMEYSISLANEYSLACNRETDCKTLLYFFDFFDQTLLRARELGRGRN